MTFLRYALYYVPPAGAEWAAFGTSWLGWDMVAGKAVDFPPGPDLPLSDITRAPRRYGLHATLKPPFRLAAGCSRKALETACADLCATLSPLRIKGLGLARMGRFMVLEPVGPDAALTRLAGECVAALDGFRAPLTVGELARRRAPGLSASQEANLTRWGYPHVMEDFRFHITLTGRLREPVLSKVEAVLGERLTPLLPAPLEIGELALAGEDGEGRFHLLRRFPFLRGRLSAAP